jgi:Ferredoxin-dependent bilin reductase
MNASSATAAVFSFTEIANRSVELLTRLGATRCVVAAPYGRHVLARDSGDVVATFDHYLLGAADVRLIRLFSNKVDVFTCFAFPGTVQRAPAYAMEFVQIGGRPIVAVLDLLSLGHDAAMNVKLDETMKSARAGYDEPNNSEVPDWYVECRSGRDIFARPTHSDAFVELGEIHNRLLASTCDEFLSAETLDAEAASAHATQIADYKHHHCVNSPGLPIMERTFGVEWTHEFMHRWVFR